MTPLKRSVFVEFNGPDQDHARGLSSDVTSTWQTSGWRPSIRSLHPKTSETPRSITIGSFQRFPSTTKKTAFNPHRLVPAQFNEFYPKRSGSTAPPTPHILPPERPG